VGADAAGLRQLGPGRLAGAATALSDALVTAGAAGLTPLRTVAMAVTTGCGPHSPVTAVGSPM